MIRSRVVVVNATGLHARPATLLVNLASSFKSDVKIEKNERIVNAKSIMGLLSLGITENEEITIIAEGEDELEAVNTLK
ncbi:MAG: sugar transporter subunit, partial [Clostridia bacterium]|nr:sugar transporter subunit [Clostridia bacterium]